MGKISLKLNGRQHLSTVVGIIIVLIVYIVLNRIISYDFLQFDHRGYFDKMFNNEPFSFMDWFYLIWNRDIRWLTINLFIIVVIILLLFRFRFKRAENFRLTKHTAIVALLCFIPAIIGGSYAMYYLYKQGELHWESQIVEFLRLIYAVGLFEELIDRGYITNNLFSLKSKGLKTPVAIAISAVIFWFVHVQGAVISALFSGTPFSIISWGFGEQFINLTFFGASMAVILYYKKDIVSLICIHAAHNILLDSYLGSGESLLMGALYAVFYAVFIVCYPVFLIYKARKSKMLRSG